MGDTLRDAWLSGQGPRFGCDSDSIGFLRFDSDFDPIPIPIRFHSDSIRCRSDSMPIRSDSLRFYFRFDFNFVSIRNRYDSIRFDSDSDSIPFDHMPPTSQNPIKKPRRGLSRMFEKYILACIPPYAPLGDPWGIR